MRRVRDKPLQHGEQMNLRNSLAAWMVRVSGFLIHNYNELVERFNSGPNI